MPDPSTLAGKALWLRAKDLGAVGTSVTSWPDQSGSGLSVATSGATVAIAKMAVTAATASSNYPGETPANVLDDAETTRWTTNGGVAAWLRLELTTTAVVGSYAIRRRDDLPNRNVRDWTFEGSDDGTTWTVLDTRTGITWPTAGETKTFTVPGTPAAYKYLRLNITANNGDTSYTSVAGMSLHIPNPPKTLSLVGGTVGVPSTWSSTGNEREMWLVIKSLAGSAQEAWFLGTSGSMTHYPYGDGNIYDGAFAATRQSYTPTLSPTSMVRLYRVAISSAGQWISDIDNTRQATVAGRTIGNRGNDARILNGWSGSLAEVLVRDRVSTAAEVSDLVAYFNSEHGLSVPGGAVPTSTATLPISVGLPVDAFSGAPTTAVLPISVGLPVEASSATVATAELPVAVGLSPRISDFVTSADLPITVGMPAVGEEVDVATSSLPIVITVTSIASITTSGTAELPFTVGIVVRTEDLVTSAELPIFISIPTSTTTLLSTVTQLPIAVAMPVYVSNVLSGFKVWNGTAWVTKPIKVWTGTAWIAYPLKYWDGATWAIAD